MPQSTKDSSGGKTHSTKNTHASGQTGDSKAEKKKVDSKSPTGPQKHGEKKTTN
jgi:hypothetical protein